MYKSISKWLLIAIAITACPTARASLPAPVKSETGSAWTWTSYLAAGLAAATPYLAYKCYKSYKAEPAAKARDNKASALCVKLKGSDADNGVHTPGIIDKREEISNADRDDLIRIAQHDDRQLMKPLFDVITDSVADYNKEREGLKPGQYHPVELSVKNALAECTIVDSYDYYCNKYNMCPDPFFRKTPSEKLCLINSTFRLRNQKFTTKAYGTLATITACSAAGLYFFGKK